jgi:hypothetical protein
MYAGLLMHWHPEKRNADSQYEGITPVISVVYGCIWGEIGPAKLAKRL